MVRIWDRSGKSKHGPELKLETARLSGHARKTILGLSKKTVGGAPGSARGNLLSNHNLATVGFVEDISILSRAYSL